MDERYTLVVSTAALKADWLGAFLSLGAALQALDVLTRFAPHVDAAIYAGWGLETPRPLIRVRGGVWRVVAAWPAPAALAAHQN